MPGSKLHTADCRFVRYTVLPVTICTHKRRLVPLRGQIFPWCRTHPFLEYLEEVGIILIAAGLRDFMEIPFAQLQHMRCITDADGIQIISESLTGFRFKNGTQISTAYTDILSHGLLGNRFRKIPVDTGYGRFDIQGITGQQLLYLQAYVMKTVEKPVLYFI